MNVDGEFFLKAFGVFTGFIIAYLSYRRSRVVDAVAMRSGQASETMAVTSQVIDGLNKQINSLYTYIDNLQEDNRDFRNDVIKIRESFRDVSDRFDDLTTRFAACVHEADVLKIQLERCEVEKSQLKTKLALYMKAYGLPPPDKEMG